MNFRNRSTHYKPRALTAKAKAAAFDMGKPLGSTAQLPAKTKRAKVVDMRVRERRADMLTAEWFYIEGVALGAETTDVQKQPARRKNDHG